MSDTRDQDFGWSRREDNAVVTNSKTGIPLPLAAERFDIAFAEISINSECMKDSQGRLTVDLPATPLVQTPAKRTSRQTEFTEDLVMRNSSAGVNLIARLADGLGIAFCHRFVVGWRQQGRSIGRPACQVLQKATRRGQFTFGDAIDQLM
jgi:hypothetical protein